MPFTRKVDLHIGVFSVCLLQMQSVYSKHLFVLGVALSLYEVKMWIRCLCNGLKRPTTKKGRKNDGRRNEELKNV